MSRSETAVLSLTGPQSHKLKMEPGVGSLIVGPKNGKMRPDLVVAQDDAINWHVFDDMRTPAGSNWPRWIYYDGNDASVFEWARTRKTEKINFSPRRDMTLDLGEARLDELFLAPQGHRLELVLPGDLRKLGIEGDPALVTFPPLAENNNLHVLLSANGDAPFTTASGLPHLRHVNKIMIRNLVLDAPFDCRSLLDHPQIATLSLYGAMDHLEALAELPLQHLDLWFMPDLARLPDLNVWPKLRWFNASNIDDAKGKELRKALKGRGEKDGGFHNVSQLRSRQWFVEEHGLPFGGWTPKNEKAASKAYKTSAALLRKAVSKEEARSAFDSFTTAINKLSDIETPERDDAGVAVELLAKIRPDLVSPDEVHEWFDAIRDF